MSKVGEVWLDQRIQDYLIVLKDQNGINRRIDDQQILIIDWLLSAVRQRMNWIKLNELIKLRFRTIIQSKLWIQPIHLLGKKVRGNELSPLNRLSSNRSSRAIETKGLIIANWTSWVTDRCLNTLFSTQTE